MGADTYYAGTHYPADLVESYRLLARSRQDDWLDSLWAYSGLRNASRAIRRHPFWRSLPDPAAVARAGRRLREISVLPVEPGGRPVVPYLPLEKDPLPKEWRSHLADPAKRMEHAARLDAAGLWDRLPEHLRVQERSHSERTGDDLRFGLLYRDRMFFVDGEDLHEQGADTLFDELAPSLAESGLALDVVELSNPYHEYPPGGDDYVVEINGIRCEVWTAAHDAGPDGDWYSSTVRPLIVVNELLEAVGARERIYVDAAGGNEGCAYLLPIAAWEVLTDPAIGRWGASDLVLMERGLW